jgi:hypothetical protein
VISLTCTSCQKVLEIDDAFAGGVCRCQFCGTIQTVPASLKNPSKSGVSTPAKTLYQKKARVPGQPGTGLEDLADAVASSSGLARGALRSNRAARPAPPPPPPPKKNLLPIFVSISAALLIVVVVLLYMLLRT